MVQLTLLLAVPLIGSLLVFLLGLKFDKLAVLLTQVISGALFVFSWTFFIWKNRLEELNVSYKWVPDFGINFSLGIDGISFVLILMTTTLVFLVTLQSPFVIQHRKGLYYGLILLFEVGILGVFTATNLIIFYVFWEMVLIPMFFLIGQWGGERRKYAAVKFFIFTHVGSVLMLVSFIVIYVTVGSFSFAELGAISEALQLIPAIGIFIGAAVKLPAVPIHSWLPDAHVEAPSPVSVLLAGLLLKMAGYAFLRLGLGLVPLGMEKLKPALLILGTLGAFYASFAAIRQKDLKRLIAFTSINHMSFIMIAVAVASKMSRVAAEAATEAARLAALQTSQLAIIGAVFLMVSHGIIIGFMFFLSGIIQHHLGTRDITKLGKLRENKGLSGALVVGSIAAFSAPPMAGFIAEMMIFFAAIPVYPWIMVVAISIAVTAVVYLWMMTRTIFTGKSEDFVPKDVHSDPKTLKIELGIVSSLMLPIFVLGFFPNLLISIISGAALQLAGGDNMIYLAQEFINLIIPMGIVLGAAVVTLITGKLKKNDISRGIGIAGLIAAIVLLAVRYPFTGNSFHPNLIHYDKFGGFFVFLFLGLSILVLLGSMQMIDDQPEMVSLILIAAVGMSAVSVANDLIFLLVAWEIMSISTYVLTGLGRKKKSTEAAMKYFIYGAVSSALVMFAVSLVYGVAGTLKIDQLAVNLEAIFTADPNNVGAIAVMALAATIFIFGFGYKMGMVPFHLWLPDVYEGAPAPVSAFLAGVAKKVAVVAAARIFFVAVVQVTFNWSLVFAIVAVITMTIGNIAALAQKNVFRMMAYSSISQVGYIMIGFSVMNTSVYAKGLAASMIHVTMHAITTVGAFLAIGLISYQRSLKTYDDYKGLGPKKPVIAVSLAVMLISLAGIPPLGGFFSKLYLFQTAVEGGMLWLTIVGVLNSVLSLGYYLP